MPDRNTAPGADSAAAARRIARWAAAARPALAAVPEPGPQQAWMVMHAIAQACGDPAMRLVATDRAGPAPHQQPQHTGDDRLGCRTPTRRRPGGRHPPRHPSPPGPWPRRWPTPWTRSPCTPPSCATIASDFPMPCAPTCRERPPPWPESRGRATPRPDQPSPAALSGHPGLDTASHPAVSHPAVSHPAAVRPCTVGRRTGSAGLRRVRARPARRRAGVDRRREPR